MSSHIRVRFEVKSPDTNETVTHHRLVRIADLVSIAKPKPSPFRSLGDLAAQDPDAFDREMDAMARYFGQN